MMDIKTVYDFEFDKETKKFFKIKTAADFKGIYDYDKKTVYINLGCYEYDGLGESEMGLVFGETVVHETVHHCIYKAMKKYWVPTKTEERFVEIMAGDLQNEE